MKSSGAAGEKRTAPKRMLTACFMICLAIYTISSAFTISSFAENTQLEDYLAAATSESSSIGSMNITRIYGKDRYETSEKIAERMMSILGINRFDTVIVASGDDYADALSASYLAAVNNAPIIITNSGHIAKTADFVKRILKTGGRVYLIGGVSVLPDYIRSRLSGYDVVRLYGDDRYGTNIAVLRETNVTSQKVLVCSGHNYPDAVAASAVGYPVLLVGSSLTSAQVSYTATLSTKEYYLIGGDAVVPENIGAELPDDAIYYRKGGADRYETAAIVARSFFGAYSTSAVIASGEDYPDGVCAGPLARTINAPLLLAGSSNTKSATTYMNMYTSSAYIVGGQVVLNNTSMHGIDVSFAQGPNIDWNRVAASGIEFVIARIGRRTGVSAELGLDIDGINDIIQAKKTGLQVGAYFFTQAVNEAEAIEEADFAVKALKDNGISLDLPLVIDTEYQPGFRHNYISWETRTRVVKAFCERVKSQGYTPMIYASTDWLNNHLDMNSLPYDVWVAQWSNKVTYGGTYSCWQYTSSGRVDGIRGNVDMDIWYF